VLWKNGASKQVWHASIYLNQQGFKGEEKCVGVQTIKVWLQI